MIKAINSSVIYENPLPQLRSRQSVFPYICECKNGSLAAIHVIGEAFESVDAASHISFSWDGGKTWSQPKPMFDKSGISCPVSDSCKVTALEDGRLIALGYAYIRKNPELPVGNPETGGLLDDFVFYSISEDNGNTWGPMITIPCAWGPHVEASAPLLLLRDGTLITPITGFPDWEGNMTGPMCGRALCSRDGGKTWNDDAVCMEFGGRMVTCYEQRMCQLESGAVLCIGWNEDVVTGQRLENHYTVSYDGGRTWSDPQTTGILGQASSVCSVGGEFFMALHAVRRDTECPGIYGCVVDFSKKRWDIVEKQLLWKPETPVRKDSKMAEIFSYLKFGQPGAVRLNNGKILMTHWYAQEGQYKTVCTELDLQI